jgi:hypothetical protein
MAATTLVYLFPRHEDLTALGPDDLGGVIMELMPPLLQSGLFNPAALVAQVFQIVGPSYPPGVQRAVDLAIAEALSWLVTQGLLVPDPGQPPPGFYVPTRRARNLRTRVDLEAFRKGRILPDDLLPPLFVEKVVPLFRRGDHDIAVFQAFKEVEIAVRKAANAKGAGYADSEVGTALMRKAFHPDNGPFGTPHLSLPSGRQIASLQRRHRARKKSGEPPGRGDHRAGGGAFDHLCKLPVRPRGTAREVAFIPRSS